MILIIDNYDSFVYNLAQYLGELGRDPLVVRNDKISLVEIERLAPSHIVISPGPCTPLEAGISNSVVLHFGGKIPLLGVWRTGGSCPSAYAWQELFHLSRRQKGVQGVVQSSPGRTVSLFNCRVGSSNTPDGDSQNIRRYNNGHKAPRILCGRYPISS
jgi:hypothetical protein